MQYLYVAGTMHKCLPTGGVRLQEVSVSGGLTVIVMMMMMYVCMMYVCSREQNGEEAYCSLLAFCCSF